MVKVRGGPGLPPCAYLLSAEDAASWCSTRLGSCHCTSHCVGPARRRAWLKSSGLQQATASRVLSPPKAFYSWVSTLCFLFLFGSRCLHWIPLYAIWDLPSSGLYNHFSGSGAEKKFNEG